MIPSFWIALQGFESSVPMISCLCLGLALYALDLADFREAFFFGIWIAVFLMTMVSSWFILVEDEEDVSGVVILFYLLQIGINALLFVCGACWITLQLQWLSNSSRTMLEQALHAVLPLISAAVITVGLAMGMEGILGRDTAAFTAPFLFAFCLFVAMLTLGCATQSCSDQSKNMSKDGAATNQDNHSHDKKYKKSTFFIVSSPITWGHTALLLIGPTAMHLATSLRRIVSSYANTDDFYDVVLVASVPFLLQYAITILHETSWRPNPYATPILGNATTLSGVLRPMIVGLLASFAFQQRFMISISHNLSVIFDNAAKTPPWLTSVYLTAATFAFIVTISLWGRVSTVTNQPLFGEYHEDVLQLGLSLTGLFLGKGVGLPWNFTPLPVLAFLGLSLWFTTRMLRYLAIFLFVLHATGVVVFTYRFSGMDQKVALPLWGINLSLFRFATLVVGCSILIGFVAGIAIRSGGGYGHAWVRKFDVTGMIFILYSVLLSVLEIALLKRPVPVSELVGVMANEAEADDMLYDTLWVFATAATIIAVSTFMHNVKIITGRTFAIIVSLAIGKVVAVYVDAADVVRETKNGDETSGAEIFWRSILTAVLCTMMSYPRFLLKPVYVKTAAKYRRSLVSGIGNTQLPPGSGRVAIVYVFIILPLALLVSIPYVLIPLANAVKSDFRGTSYYDVKPPASEVMGFAMTLWGTSSLFMLNYYLPDGGGEVWKKVAALGFLSGFGVFFVAPTLGSAADVVSNPYATISTVGMQLANRGKSQTGGWGLVSAGFATLLALTGPLELKERRTDSVRRDKFLLFRTLVFSIMFGGGVSWFFIMMSMSEASWMVLLLTGLSCLSISFLGTISSVLGFFLELEDVEEVEQIFTIFLIAVPIFLPVTGVPQFLNVESSHPFGIGGWLSTYLVICSSASLAFALSMRSRSTKNAMTRGLANTSVVLSWLFSISVLYGRYGAAGMDVNYDVTTVFGIPASIFGTFVLSILLLALEGESADGENRRTKRVSSQSKKPTKSESSIGLVLENLSASNMWVPPVAGTALILILASLYVVFLRGAGFVSWMDGSTAARSHEEVFSKVFGNNKDEHDLATLAERAMLHAKALATSSKLAGAGFWTARGMLGPILHLVGIASVLPSLYWLVVQGWGKTLKKLSSLAILCLPLNAIPLVVSRGIPSLQAAAILGLVGSAIQFLLHRRQVYNSKMRI